MNKLLSVMIGVYAVTAMATANAYRPAPPLTPEILALSDEGSKPAEYLESENAPPQDSLAGPLTDTQAVTHSPAPTESPRHLESGFAAQPQAPESIWKRVRGGFAMEDIDGPLVKRHQAWFINHPEYFQRMIERSRLYLYFIVDEIDKRNMPMEVALLPMIESAFNPIAYSRARAVGIWQFMPLTGKRYGLQQNWWYDGRRDVLSATRAALDYLEALHGQFGDWQLALASYNWGENAVARAMSKNRAQRKSTEYKHLRMPRETRNYLPKLQAVKNIIANPSLLRSPLQDIPDQPYFTTIPAPDHMDLQLAAYLAEMSVDEFRLLNPGHTRPVIMSTGSHSLLLPAEKAGIFHANLKTNERPLLSWQTYTLKKNENLNMVAEKFSMTPARLREINGLKGHVALAPGRSLLVPLTEEGTASNLGETWNSPQFQAPEDLYGGRVVYRVRTGDSLYYLALKHRVSVAALKEWNHLKGTHLRIGQRLTIYTNPRIARR